VVVVGEQRWRQTALAAGVGTVRLVDLRLFNGRWYQRQVYQVRFQVQTAPGQRPVVLLQVFPQFLWSTNTMISHINIHVKVSRTLSVDPGRHSPAGLRVPNSRPALPDCAARNSCPSPCWNSARDEKGWSTAC